MAKKQKKNGHARSTPADKLVAAEKKLDDFIAALKGKGEKILAETEEIAKGLQNINPLAIGHRLTVIREYFGVSKKDRHTNNSKMFEIFKRTKVYRLGFTKPTVNRYIGAWEAAVKVAPEPFITELASRLFGERVSDEKPFGRFTSVVGSFVHKHKKEELSDGRRVGAMVDTILQTKLTTTGRGGSSKGSKKKSYILVAYDAVMDAIHRQLVADQSRSNDPLEAKDRFFKDLVPLVLRGFGLHPDFEIGVPEICQVLPAGYESYTEKFVPAEPKQATAPMGEADRSRKPMRAAAAEPERSRKPMVAAAADTSAPTTVEHAETPTVVAPHDHHHHHAETGKKESNTPVAAS